MTEPVTVALALVGLGLTGLFGFLGARPARPFGAPRLVPWRVLMLVSFAVTVAALVHAVALVKGP